MKRREVIRLGAASMVLVPATGCATLMNLFQKYIPKLSVKRMQITGMTLTTLSTKFFCQITNPNPIGFRLDGLDYLLRLAGIELAKGTAPKGVTLRPRGAAETDFDVHFALGNSAAAILDLLDKKTVDYELQAVGKFFTQQTGGIDIPVGFQGKMPMPRVPNVSVRAFNATSVSASSVGFRVDTSVHNDNGFEIPIDGFKFNLKLDGKQVLTNRGARGLRVPPKQTSSVPLDFNVSLAALGLSLAEIAAGKRMNWELGTQLQSGKLVVPFTNKGAFRFS